MPKSGAGDQVVMTTDGLNRFAYVRNNPMTYNDPSGHGVIIDDTHSCPASRPDCLNDGGPGPIGGSGPADPVDPCDANCHMLRGIYDYCHGSGASDPSCGGGPAPVAEPAPTPSCPPSCAPDTRESSGGCGAACDFIEGVAKRGAKALADNACAVTGAMTSACEAVRVAIVDTGFYKTQCFRGITKFGATGLAMSRQVV